MKKASLTPEEKFKLAMAREGVNRMKSLKSAANREKRLKEGKDYNHNFLITSKKQGD